MKPIAHIENDFPAKFGIPRQSGLVKELKARIIFEPEYRIAEAVCGLDGYSYIWLIWEFSAAIRKASGTESGKSWSPTVRPPRLGGNTHMGVFATRSPFRPNPLGLSSVRLERIEFSPTLGPVLHVSGADLMSQTPIYDIKPYLPYADCHPEAAAGFTEQAGRPPLQVCCPQELLHVLPEDSRAALYGILAQDPRPSYQKDPQRVYGFAYAGCEIHFRVDGEILTVLDITRQ